MMDTPGTYSLDAKSLGEEVTRKALFSHKDLGNAQVVVVVVDDTQLMRQLLLAQQMISAGFRVIVAVTMADSLAKAKATF